MGLILLFVRVCDIIYTWSALDSCSLKRYFIFCRERKVRTRLVFYYERRVAGNARPGRPERCEQRRCGVKVPGVPVLEQSPYKFRVYSK